MKRCIDGTIIYNGTLNNQTVCNLNKKEAAQSFSSKIKTNKIIQLRVLMAGKDVGTIIGKHGENIKNLRSKSGAYVKITDGSLPERIVTISGTVSQVAEAFRFICQALEDDFTRTLTRLDESNVPAPIIILRLLFPAIYCGSIIGKGGAKIKQLRELTGASIQIAPNLLPFSSDRAITVSGKLNAVLNCTQQFCYLASEMSLKAAGTPYLPRRSNSDQSNIPVPTLDFSNQKSLMYSIPTLASPCLPIFSPFPSQINPSLLALLQFSGLEQTNAKLNCLEAPFYNFSLPIDPVYNLPSAVGNNVFNLENAKTHARSSIFDKYDDSLLCVSALTEMLKKEAQFYHTTPERFVKLPFQEVESYDNATLPICLHNQLCPIISPDNLKDDTEQKLKPSIDRTQTEQYKQEIIVSNDLIGCVIGRCGNKINEIRKISQAKIKISNGDDQVMQRRITISGTLESVEKAEKMIANSLLGRELIKVQLNTLNQNGGIHLEHDTRDN